VVPAPSCIGDLSRQAMVFGILSSNAFRSSHLPYFLSPSCLTSKFPEVVNVYYSGGSLDDAFSKEICGGPHVEHTGTIGKFVILKEKAVSAGVRRIRADVK